MDALAPSHASLPRFPATSAQARFQYLDQAIPDFTGRNLAIQWELRGSFRNESVERAMAQIIDRHEILRTRLIEVDGEIVQEVEQRVEFRMGMIDVRSLPEAERESRIGRIITEVSTAPFDLSRPCPFRLTLVRFAPDRAMLLIAVHHAVFDGFSIRVLGREIGALITAEETGVPAELPALQLQYGDYARWQAACADSPARANSGAFWVRTLGGAPYFELPSDRPRAPLGVRNGVRLDTALPSGFADQIASAARAQNLSPFAFGAAIFAASLHRETGARDISFGTAVAGRDAPELEDMIGVFVNPVILRYPLGGAQTLGDVTATSGEVVRAALAHADHPFDDVARQMQVHPDPLRTPLASVFFTLGHVFLEEHDYGAVSLASVASATPGITHDLSVQIMGRKSGWKMMIDYDADRFDAARIEALSAQIVRTFADAFAAPVGPLSDLEAVTKAPAPAPSIFADPPSAQHAPSKTVDQIAPLWAEVLGLPESACDADFFDLGGHSLLALRMLARLETICGVRPSITDFLAAPTLRGLAATVDAMASPAHEDNANPWRMIELGKGTGLAPLLVTINQPFLFHSVARKLGARTVSLHLEDVAALDQQGAVRLLATQAAALVTEAAGDRPVVLMGHCVDGILARAIADQMTAGPMLLMVDSWAPGTFEEVAPLARKVQRWVQRLRRWQQYFGQKWRGQLSWDEFWAKNSFLERRLVAKGRVSPATDAEQREVEINHKLFALLKHARFGPYAGEAILFQSGGQRSDARARLFGWQGLLGADTPVHDLPGWHEDAFQREGADVLAGILNARLGRL